MAAGDRDRWNDKWAAAGVGTGHGSKLTELLTPWLPEQGRLLDIAGGGSADSIAFARLGFDVTVCDVSDIGLIQARERARAEDLVIDTIEIDLELAPVPEGPWDIITIANYLQRDLLGRVAATLTPGGVVGIVIATTMNLQRHTKPGADFLLHPGELPSLLDGLEILHHSESWRPNDRHEAHFVARRRPGSFNAPIF